MLNDLPQAAGSAAMNMPEPRIMELWHSQGTDCFIFGFEVNNDSAALTIMHNWCVVQKLSALNVWMKGAEKYTSHGELSLNRMSCARKENLNCMGIENHNQAN
ncbi:hypothetical protein QBC46DRAFT_372435 [Diplogelasinospora grovesii]|uniref:DUF6546 domain-containing protein n=1 Tax=Diplogelasinospora grovesii TaxID=303347 RepID=A0AAN6NH28_9PEZI|nr:hypothetical protein QBC46DRAFT_372435 [Diplogelasinospora grovesii]